MEILTKRIVELRTEKEISLKQLAAALAVDKLTVAGWEHGVTPRTTHLIKLSEYFEVSVDYLLGIIK